MFFIMSTGRCGNHSLVHALNSHSQLTCKQESMPEIIKYSRCYSSGLIDGRTMQKILCENLDYPWNVGESCAQMWPVVSMTAAVLPDSKFIWLKRNIADVVASYYHTRKAWTTGSKLGIYKEHILYKYVNGVEVGDLTRSEWVAKSRFEKTCWFLNHVLQRLEEQLSELPQERFITLNIEDLDLNQVFKFLNVASEDINLGHIDASNPPKLTDKELKWIENNMNL